MKNAIVPAILLSVALASSAFAATTQSSKGAVKYLNTAERTVTLDNNMVYKLPASYDATKLKIGEKINIIWEMKDGAHQAETITPATN